jgi:hypothetical protein
MNALHPDVEVENQAYDMIASHDIERAREDLRFHAQKLMERLQASAKWWTTQPAPDRPDKLYLRPFLATVIPMLRTRRLFEDRLARFSPPEDNGEVSPPPTLPRPSLAQEAESLALRSFGPERTREALADLVADISGNVEVELLNADRELAPFANMKQGFRWRSLDHTHDSWVEALWGHVVPLLATRRHCENRLARLRGDPEGARRAVGDSVKAAVRAAGGRDLVVRGLRESAILSGKFLEGDPCYADLLRAKAEIASLRQQFEALGAPVQPERGSHAETLANRIGALKAQVASLVASATERRSADLGSLVDAACNGSEKARAELSKLAAALPSGFKTGFPEAIAAAAFSGSDFAPIVAEVEAELQRELDQFEASQRVVVKRVPVPQAASVAAEE